jgi:hypothetical protein
MPESRLSPNAHSARSQPRLHFLLPESPPAELQIFPQRSNGALVQSNVTDIGYYIRSRLLSSGYCYYLYHFKM